VAVRPRQFVAEDACSFAASHNDSYGILQFSFVDTYADTAAGAFALTKSSFYMTEAWGIFFKSLDPRGILSVTRYDFSNLPAEFYRPLGLAAATLRERRVGTPGDHMVVLRHPRNVPSGSILCAAAGPAYSSSSILPVATVSPVRRR